LCDPRSLWHLSEGSAARRERVSVIDLVQGRVVRDLGELLRPIPIFGGAEPLVAATKQKDKALVLFNPRGAVVRESRFSESTWVRAAAVHPSGAGQVLFDCPLPIKDIDPDGKGPRRPLYCQVVEESGAMTHRELLPFPHGLGRTAAATSLLEGLTFYICLNDGEDPLLAALAPGPGGMRTRYFMPVPVSSILQTNPSSQQVVLVAPDDRGVQTHRLGAAPPRVRMPALLPDRSIVDLLRTAGCFRSPQPGDSGPEDPFWDGRPFTVAERAAMQASLYRGEKVAPGQVEAALDDLLRKRRWAPLHEVAAWALDHGVDGPQVRLVLAQRALADDEVDKARDHLLSVSPALADGLDPARRRHFYHLLTVCHLRKDEPVLAGAALHRAAESKGRCKLRDLQALFKPPLKKLPAGERDGRRSVLRQLASLIHRADGYLARGDLVRARQVLDCPVVWRQMEVQCLARLAEAYLGFSPTDGPSRFRRMLALASFCESHSQAWAWRLPLPVGTWDRARLDGLFERAKEALSAARQDLTKDPEPAVEEDEDAGEPSETAETK
jgi:hypothetical protein